MACLERADNHMCNSGASKCVIQIISNSPCLVLLRRRGLKCSCMYTLFAGQLIPTSVRSHSLLPLVLTSPHPMDGATAPRPTPDGHAALPACHSLHTWLTAGKMLACEISLLPCCSNRIALCYLLLCIRLASCAPLAAWRVPTPMRLLSSHSSVSALSPSGSAAPFYTTLGCCLLLRSPSPPPAESVHEVSALLASNVSTR